MADFGKLNFSVSFNPTSAFPLDARCYFESLTEAQAAAATADVAGSSTTTYYYGETLVVVENNTATMYVIQPDKTLAEVGGNIELNENVFITDDNGKIDLYGFTEAVAGAQLTKGADGKISWVKPDTTTVEGLSTEVESLRTDVDGITEDVGTLTTDVNALKSTVGDSTAGLVKDVADLETAVATKANTADVYTKSEADTAIAEAVAGASHLTREIVEALPSVDSADENTIYMVSADTGTDSNVYDEYLLINGVFEKIGDTAVDISGKVDKVDGSRLMTEAEGTKLAGIEEGADVNVIESVKVNGVALNITNKSVNIPVGGDSLGTVKSASGENKVAINTSGEMSVSSVNVNTLTQTEGETLILNGGSSSM